MKRALLVVCAGVCLTLASVGLSVAAEQVAQVQTKAIAVNVADAKELQGLPGIGPAIAQRIVEYRTAHGPFAKVDDLQKVKGVGKSTLEKIRSRVTLN